MGLTAYPGVYFPADSPDLYPATGGQSNTVTIPMQGTRGRDDTQAFKESGIDRGDADNYTWHHVDDFNPDTGETTMQLVKTSAHQDTFPHSGSPNQFKDEFGVKYDSPEAVKISQQKGWLRGDPPY